MQPAGALLRQAAASRLQRCFAFCLQVFPDFFFAVLTPGRAMAAVAATAEVPRVSSEVRRETAAAARRVKTSIGWVGMTRPFRVLARALRKPVMLRRRTCAYSMAAMRPAKNPSAVHSSQLGNTLAQ